MLEGVLFVLSGPSGSGKSTLGKLLLEHESNMCLSISHTTRQPRGAEVHGKEYYFVDDLTFTHMIEQNDFLEWAEVHGRRYGTSLSFIREKMQQGYDVLLDIDVQGGKNIISMMPSSVLVFVIPPKFDVLVKRLHERQTDTAESIQKRLQAAKQEIEEASSCYPYWVINEQLQEALADIRAILKAEKIKKRDRTALKAQFFGRK